MTPDVTRDRFLGGRIEVLQPAARHHRAGLDAVLLAAALPDGLTGRLVDLGAGVGVAGLCAAARLPGVTVTLVERDETALQLARDSLALPVNVALAKRVTVRAADITATGRTRQTQGLVAGMADHIIMNPPYYDTRHRASPHAARADAHVLAEGGLDRWLRTASDLLVAGGTLTVIFRADGLEDMLAALRGRFGGIMVLPLFPRAGQQATRIILRGTRGSKAPLQLFQGQVIHAGEGYTAPIETALRDGAGLRFET